MKTQSNFVSVCHGLSLAICLGSSLTTAQEYQGKSFEKSQYLSKLPTDLTLVENGPQQYRLQTIWYNRDLHGNPTGKFIISGDYTRGLGNGQVRWNNVRIAVFEQPGQQVSDTIVAKSMEALTYQSPHDIAKPDFFKYLPANQTKHLLRTLVWDVVALEAIAWQHFDKLELNKTVKSSEFENLNVQMADWGTLTMKDLKLNWTGISKMQDEPCAVIHYKSFVNPVDSLGFQGRSLYWGNILVSLHDKQIEHATLNEDVIMEISTAPGSEKKIMNIQRDVNFEKIR